MNLKKFWLSVLGVIVLCSAYAQDNPKNIFGVRAGYAASWATTRGVAASVRHGYAAGVSDQILLDAKVPFYFETGLNFIAKGYEIRGYDDSSTTFNYLQLPATVNYHIHAGKHVTIEPGAGFYYAFGLGGKRRHGGESSQVFKDGSTSRHDFGFTCGLSASIYRLHIGLAWETGLINIDKNDTVYGNDSLMLGYKKLRNNSIVVRIGVNF